jgi:hypothetical protein
MFNLTEIKIKYVHFVFKISYLIKINTILNTCHIKTHVELSNMINVIKIIHLKGKLIKKIENRL